jgi:hypothetical protein
MFDVYCICLIYAEQLIMPKAIIDGKMVFHGLFSVFYLYIIAVFRMEFLCL